MHITVNGIQIGPALISTFALIVIGAVLVGVVITWYRARSKGENAALAFDLGTWTLLLSVVMGRLIFVASPPPSVAAYYSRDWYFSHPLDLLAGPVAVWNGGLETAGVMLGIILGAAIVLRRDLKDRWLWADLLIPGLLAAAAILPWSNLLTGQLLGPPSNLPWAVAANAAPSVSALRYEPAPAYLSMWAACVLAFTLFIAKRHQTLWAPGLVCLVAGIAYLPGMFAAEFLREDVSRPFLGLTPAQSLCIVLEITLVGMAVRRSKRGMKDQG
jgi:phosphatidylglycerol---prolipoprotein diacylglyceryl transferase